MFFTHLYTSPFHSPSLSFTAFRHTSHIATYLSLYTRVCSGECSYSLSLFLFLFLPHSLSRC